MELNKETPGTQDKQFTPCQHHRQRDTAAKGMLPCSAFKIAPKVRRLGNMSSAFPTNATSQRAD